jgi:hypothetical protein
MNKTFNNLAAKADSFVFFNALLAFILIVLSYPLFAQEKEKRWFEFEVILFKLKSEDGLYAESWKDDSQLNISENAVDFLQPYEMLELIKGFENSKVSTELTIDSANELPNKPKLSEDEAGIEESEQMGEEPFIRLANEILQLNSESKSINRQSRYQLIDHFSWRQPVDSRANATKIRIAGGFDYSENFEYNGEKKIEFIPIVENINDAEEILGDDLESPFDLKNPIQKNVEEFSDNLSIADNVTQYATQDLIQEPAVVPEPKPLDWVPEIDGEIKVYIHRKYLHVDTNLVYRKPKEIAVDIFHLDEQSLSYSFTEQNSLQPNLLETALDDTLESPLDNSLESVVTISEVLSNSQKEKNGFQEASNNFNWEFDADFLNKKAEKLFTKKLFNYPLIQDRRVRSGELHYFDHPLIGMLIMIRPFETEIFEDDLIEPAASEISN